MKKNFSIDVSLNTSLSQKQRDSIMYELAKKLLEIVGDEYDGTCLVYSEREGVAEYKKELSDYYEWFNKLKAEKGIQFKHEILTKCGIDDYNKCKDWNKKLKEMSLSLKFTDDDEKEILKQILINDPFGFHESFHNSEYEEPKRE